MAIKMRVEIDDLVAAFCAAAEADPREVARNMTWSMLRDLWTYAPEGLADEVGAAQGERYGDDPDSDQTYLIF
jgi:hypothetical protein